tara:strand:- start:1570 stop:2184 length:615 start_codon:yes stop_codon:yes gene_type:complete
MIYCKNFFEDDDCTSYYIGSYGENEKRYIGHKSDCNNPKSLLYNIKLYKTIRENGGWDNWDMIIIHSQKYKTKKESKIKEQYFIDIFEPDLNMIRAYNSPELKKELDKKKSKKRREKNSEFFKTTHKCACGGNYTYQNKSRHINSKQHKDWEKNIEEYSKKQESIKLKKTKCSCGGEFNPIKGGLSRHLRTKLHKAWMEKEGLI